MAEEILGQDEVKRIAIEYVVYKENVGYVEITNPELRSENEPYIYKVQGVAWKHVIKQNIVYPLAECHFTLLISNRDKKIIYYMPSEWFYHYSVHDLLEDQQGYREV